ncbi:diguanylate cyclase (GGDEF)-like protein [Oxalobacteraceae bacterium GrIS 1.18]
MLEPASPDNEVVRIEALRALHILDTTPEERFDRLTRLARRLFNVPVALISLTDTNRQWFKSAAGISDTELPRNTSFCGHAILADELFMVPDALADHRFSDNPQVIGAPFIRFYAGYPLSSKGNKLGTLCLLDMVPRDLNDDDKVLLKDLARMVEQEIDAVQMATIDALTGLSNRRGFVGLGQHALTVCKRLAKPASLLFLDLNDFKKINDDYGHAEGDRALRTFAELLRIVFRESDIVGRLGGDEFVVLLTDASSADTSQTIERFRDQLNAINSTENRGYKIRFSVGQIAYRPERHLMIDTLLSDADAAMYANKQQMKLAH